LRADNPNVTSWEPYLVGLVVNLADTKLCPHPQGDRSQGRLLGCSLAQYLLSMCMRFQELVRVHRVENKTEIHAGLEELLDCTGQCNRFEGYITGVINNQALQALDIVWRRGMQEEPIPFLAQKIYYKIIALRDEAERLERSVKNLGRKIAKTAAARQRYLTQEDRAAVRAQWEKALDALKSLEEIMWEVTDLSNAMNQLMHQHWDYDRAAVRNNTSCWLPPRAPRGDPLEAGPC